MVTFIQFSCALTVVTVSALNPKIGRMVGILGMIFFSLILIGKNKQIFPLNSAGAAHIFSSKASEAISGMVFLLANAYAIFYV